MLGEHGRGITKGIFTPVARWVTRLHITPNMVTIGGTVATIAVAAAVLATGFVWQGCVALGVVLFMDSLDGVLARLTHQESTFGAVLDSTLDRLGDGAVFGALTFFAATGMEQGATRLISIIAGLVAMVGVATVPYAKARAEAAGGQASVGIAERTDRLITALVGAFIADLSGWWWFYALGLGLVAVASIITVIQRLVATRESLPA